MEETRYQIRKDDPTYSIIDVEGKSPVITGIPALETAEEILEDLNTNVKEPRCSKNRI